MTRIWDEGPAQRAELLVLLVLADFSNDAGECWPAISTIAKKSRMTERGAQKILRKLEADGWVSIATGNGRGGCNQYNINPEQVFTPERPFTPEQVFTPPRTGVHPPPEQVFTQTPNRCSPEPLRTVIEPSSEPSLGKQAKQSRKCRLPDGWVPNDRNIQDATDRQFSEKEIHDEAAKFRDYHHAKGTTFADWNAGWRTWLGNARKFGARGQVAGSTFAARGGRSGSIASIAAKRRAAGSI